MKALFIRSVLITATFILIPFFALSSNPGKVEGLVKDAKTHLAVPYATVELLKRVDSTLVKAILTNNEGRYVIEDIKFGKYLLRISCIGYQKIFVSEFEISPNNFSINFNSTYLTAEAISLNEVVVTGHKLTGILKDDKTIYMVSKKSAEIAQSSLELLRQLPDVTVDYISENVKLAGSTNILFQVEGRKVDRNYLSRLNPELVDVIEVITNPGAKYTSDVDAVINVVLRKDMIYGLSGRMRFQVPTSATVLSKNNGNLDLFFKKARFYVGGNYNLYRYNTLTTNNRSTYSSDSSELTQNTNGKNNGKKAGINYGIDWFLNDHNTFNFYSTIRPQIPEKSDFISDNIFTLDNISSHNIGRNTNIDKNYFYDYSLYYLHKFAKKLHEISFESYLSNKSNSKTSDYFEQDYISGNILSEQLSNRLNQKTENSNKQLILKVDYTYPFSEKLKFSTGYYGNFFKSDYLYSNIITDYSSLLNYCENRNALYSNFSLNAGKLNIQTGARYEFSDIRIKNDNEKINNQYNTLLPSISVLYKPGKKSTFRLNYRKSITRPNVNQLSPTNYKEDSYQQSIGNPNLKPAKIDRIEFTHTIQTGKSIYVSYKPYLSLIKNDIRLVNMATSDSVLLRKYNNVSNDIEYGVSLYGSFTLLKNWTISPSWTYYRRELQALPEYGINEPMKRTSWRLNISSQLILPREWVLFLEYNYNAPIINYQSTTHQLYDFATGFNKPINKKLNISVFTLNPWSNRYVYDNKTITTSNMTQETKDAIKFNYLFIIRLGYKFNSAKVGNKLERQVETEEEKGLNKGVLN